MKGVLAVLAPEALVIDIAHELPPQDILRAGLVWRAALPFFPRGSVHVAVVDPGVGGRRRILAFEARGSILLAPDNGLIGYVASRPEILKAIHVCCRKYFLETVSATFHGRDIFAPVAARLARGLPLESLGPQVKSYRVDVLPRPRRRRVRKNGRARLEERGRIVSIDHFGNAVTNLCPVVGGRLLELSVGGNRLALSQAYSDVEPGRPLVLVGSLGYLEVAVNCGSAAGSLGLKVGDEVFASWRERRRVKVS